MMGNHNKHRTTEVLVLSGIILLLMFLRTIPEFQIGTMPVGFDSSTSYIEAFYSPATGIIDAIKNFNILYYIFWCADYFGIDAFIAIKTIGVILFGLLNLSLYLFLRTVTKFKQQYALVGMLIFAFQLATLRISWDLFRNELGIIFALLSMWQFIKYRDRKNYLNIIASLTFGILTVGTHQMVGLLYLLLLLIIFLYHLVQKFSSKTIAQIIVFVCAIIWIIVAKYISFGNYSLWAIYENIDTRLTLNLFSMLYLPILPLVIIGLIVKIDKFILNIFTFVILAQSTIIFVLSDQGFYLWDRWMYFLVVPFTIYSVYALEYVCTLIAKHIPKLKHMHGLIALIIALPLILSSMKFLQADKGLNFYALEPEIGSYLPKSIVWNSLGQPNMDEIIQSVNCLRENYDGKSTIYTNRKYIGVIYYYLPELVDNFKFVSKYTTPRGYYYVFGEHTDIANPGKIINGSSKAHPVYANIKIY